MVAIASLTILGSQAHQQPAVKPLKPGTVAFHRPQRPGAIRFRLSATPTPTPVTPPPAAPVAAARPAPPAPAPPRPPAPPVSAVGGAAGVEFSLVNQDRAANGSATLAWSGSLARVAQYRAQDMLNRNYFSHYDPATGQLAFVQLLHLWGIPYSTAGENIAWSTNPSMAGINTMFMNSPEHRANILNGGYHRMGVGVAGNGAKTMVVEVFSN
jgi:uncharacterized protein YkwD